MMKMFNLLRKGFLLWFLFVLPMNLYADEGIIEKEITYTVAKGDYGELIEGKLGISWSDIAAANSINPRAPLAIGQLLKVKFRRIIPARVENGIIINIPDRTLYRFSEGKLKDYYFISAGKPTWQTPLGEFTIKSKAKDPTWYVPVSIQKEMGTAGRMLLWKYRLGLKTRLGNTGFSFRLKE